MAGRHRGRERRIAPVLELHGRELLEDGEPFWSYLRYLTWPTYLGDFIRFPSHRYIAGLIVGIACFGYGVGRMFVHPGWQTLGVILFGFAFALTAFLLPLVIDLVCASLSGTAGTVQRRRSELQRWWYERRGR